MGYFIGIEDLAANALIETMKNKKLNFISYSSIEEYGSRVIQFLGNKNEKAVLVLSRNSTNEMFRNYSDYFEEKNQDGELGIQLKDGKTVYDLIDCFRGYWALDVLLAFVNCRSLEALGILK